MTTTGGPVKDPNTEYLMVGVGKASCQQPHQAGCDAWYVSIEIPPALFHPGVIELGCGSASGYFSYTGVGQPGGYCSGGHGGPFYHGTVEILNISATNVVFRLSNTPAFGVPADGMYNLPRCP